MLKMQQARPHDEGMAEQEQQVGRQRITREEFCQSDTKHITISPTGAPGTSTRVRQCGALGINYAIPAPLTRTREYRPMSQPHRTKVHQDYHQRRSCGAAQSGAIHKQENAPVAANGDRMNVSGTTTVTAKANGITRKIHALVSLAIMEDMLVSCNDLIRLEIIPKQFPNIRIRNCRSIK